MRKNILCNKNNGGQELKTPLSVSKNTYIIGHYNSADFSMLSDFYEIKKTLNIVNKSFVTMGKPLKFNNSYVYVRDTILIAPGGKQSLADLGKLYENEGDFNKRKLTPLELSNMKALLRDNKKNLRTMQFKMLLSH